MKIAFLIYHLVWIPKISRNNRMSQMIKFGNSGKYKMSNSFPFYTFLNFLFHNKDGWFNENYLYLKYKSTDVQSVQFYLDILKEKSIFTIYGTDINDYYETRMIITNRY